MTSIQTTIDPRAEALGIVVNPRVDELEAALVKMTPAVLRRRDQFVKGMYIRTLIMPAGSIVTGEIHLTEHPWVMLRGRMLVHDVDENGEWTHTEIVAPASGITRPGARRVAEVLEETEWTTYHATDLTDPDEIQAAITLDHKAHRGGITPITILEDAPCRLPQQQS